MPITDDDIPSLNVRVDMVGTDERIADDGTPLPDTPLQPAYAAGQLRLQIPPVSRTLDVAATPAAEQLEPGASTSVSVAVNGPDGAAVPGAGVALIVVDEAVLSLTGYELANPLDTFYQPGFSQLDPQLLHDSIILTNPDLLSVDGGAVADGAPGDVEESAEAMEDEGGATADFDVAAEAAPSAADGRVAGIPDGPIDVRADFDALAVFAPTN